MLTFPHSGECSRILYTSEHQVSLSTSEHQVQQSICLSTSEHQVRLSVCVCRGVDLSVSVSLTPHTYTHTHLLFQFYLNQPLLASGDLSTILQISWLNFLTLSDCLVWGVIFHYHQPWYHPGSKAPGAQPLIHGMFPQLPNLSSIGSFMMTIPSSYQSPPFFSPIFSGLSDRTPNGFMHVKHVFHH